MADTFFVTGTDTDVGKTVVTCALLKKAGQLGLRTMAIKPVAAGSEVVKGESVNEDALALMQASTEQLSYKEINPVLLDLAVAPHIAANKTAQRIALEPLVRHCSDLFMKPHDFSLIEGAGGWLVPLNEEEMLSDLAQKLYLPVILVVSMKLGCINHTLLTVESLKTCGNRLAGWVANCMEPDMRCLHDNIETLQRMISAPCLGVIPRLQKAGDADSYLDLESLIGWNATT